MTDVKDDRIRERLRVHLRQQGLMARLGMRGSKITRINP